MRCGEAKELIQLYLDSELDPRGALDVQRHLETCSTCSRLFDALMQQDQLLKQAARSETVNGAALRENILGAIRNQAPKAGSRWIVLTLWRRLAAVGAAIIVVALLLVGRGLLPGANPVYAAVAFDHADHCSIDSVMGAITDSAELVRLAVAHGMKAPPDLSAFGYSDPRGRVCKVTGAEFFHLVYYNPQRPPLSLFIRPHSPNLIADRLTNSASEGYEVVSVSESGVDLLIVSSLDDKQTSAIAQTVASQL